MKRLLRKLFIQTFSAGERAAFEQVKAEFRISKMHRRGLRHVRRNSWQRPARINLGSGPHRKTGYLNIDLFPGGDLTLDLRRALPFESNCCEEIFSEHCLEHFDYPGAVSDLLRECLRVLRPGGHLRFSVPDTEWPLTDYPKGDAGDYFRACAANPWWHPGDCTTRLEHINYHFRQAGEHRFAYDEETARKLLQRVGFVEVQRVAFDLTVDSPHREIGSLFITARKPAH